MKKLDKAVLFIPAFICAVFVLSGCSQVNSPSSDNTSINKSAMTIPDAETSEVPKIISDKFHKIAQDEDEKLQSRLIYAKNGWELSYSIQFKKFDVERSPLKYYAIEKKLYSEPQKRTHNVSEEKLFIYDEEIGEWVPIGGSETAIIVIGAEEKVYYENNETMWTKGNDWSAGFYNKEYNPFGPLVKGWEGTCYDMSSKKYDGIELFTAYSSIEDCMENGGKSSL